MIDPNELRTLLAQLAALDPAAADGLDRLADQLHARADAIRAGAVERPPTSSGGMGDSVRMQVVGPDGIVKQEIDTARRTAP